MQEHDDITPAAWRLATLLRSHPWRVIAVIASVMLILGAALAGIVNANTSGSDIVVSTDDANRDEGASGKEGDGDSRAYEDDVENGNAIAVTVDVDGAVMNPNVIELPEGSRVQDAIEACGGLAADADVSGINRASILQDGQKVYVPKVGEAPQTSGSATGAAATGGTLVNINTATVEDLDGLPGVGEATAQAIVDDREANGAFASIEDLMRVSGIGEKKFEKLRDLICV